MLETSETEPITPLHCLRLFRVLDKCDVDACCMLFVSPIAYVRVKLRLLSITTFAEQKSSQCRIFSKAVRTYMVANDRAGAADFSQNCDAIPIGTEQA